MNEIVKILTRRDGLQEWEAEELYQEALEALRELVENDGYLEDAEDIVKDYFGLEPDYLIDLLNDLGV